MQYWCPSEEIIQKMLKGVFITGTDTGVGKTLVGTQIITSLRQRGVAVSACKPVESGCKLVYGELRPADALRYHRALAGTVPLQQICPFRFEAAVAPPLAARMAGTQLTLDELVIACGSSDENLTLIEGAGGFYSPLAEQALNADLANLLSYPLVLVAANRLGCINHVLLTLEAIQHRGLEVLAIVLNDSDPALALAENLAQLRSLQSRPVIHLGYNAPLDVGALFSLAGHPLESLHHGVG